MMPEEMNPQQPKPPSNAWWICLVIVSSLAAVALAAFVLWQIWNAVAPSIFRPFGPQ